MVCTLDVPIHFRAEEALRERVVGIAGDAHRPAVFHGDEHRARIRAVVRARAAHDRRRGLRQGFTSHYILGAGKCKARGTRKEGLAQSLDALTDQKETFRTKAFAAAPLDLGKAP